MPKRNKRLKKAIESYKEEIEEHFEKLDKDILENDEITASYHVKEINNSLIEGMEKKMALLGESAKESKEVIDSYRKKLEEYKKKIGIGKD